MTETEKFHVTCIGLSNDCRTNKWRVYCKKCGKSHDPSTTMFASQRVVCPKCNEEEVINYNNIDK